MDLQLQMEVVGCPTVCMHCWAQGVPYAAMPLEDIRWTLEQARGFCTDAGLTLRAYPMHEVAAHPQAAEVLRMFHQANGGENPFEPFSTTGVPLATREDWQVILATLGELGTTKVWVALHGVGAEHDRMVNRVGAFEETWTAVQHVHAVGLRAGCNVFLTKQNVQQFEALVATVAKLGFEEPSWEPASFYPTARGRQYEHSRPELQDLLPIAERIVELSSLWQDRWTDLDAYTEAAYVQKALADSDGFDPLQRVSLALVCRSTLDVHSGDARLYGLLFGNLRRDGPAQTFTKALDHGPVSHDAIFFPNAALPSAAELARQVGDLQGQKVYFTPTSMRYRWLDVLLSSLT